MQQPSPFVAGERPKPACCIYKLPGQHMQAVVSGGARLAAPWFRPPPAVPLVLPSERRCPTPPTLAADTSAAAGGAGMQTVSAAEGEVPPELAPSRSVQNSDAVLMNRCMEVRSHVLPGLVMFL